MKKVTNITLGGIVFAMEEDAYERLSSYLAGIEKTFKQNDDYAEIAADIESAIAEKFIRAKKNEKRAVTLIEVKQVMEEMGQAEDLAAESGEEVGTDTVEEKNDDSRHDAIHRLYRNTDDAILGGVCSGIASYFDIDPVIVRVAFVIAAFLNGIGVLFYILLWLIVPAAVTPTQKYAMRGEQMTITQITTRVKKKINNLETSNLPTVKSTGGLIRKLLETFFQIVGKVIRFGLETLRYLVGFVFVLVGSLCIAFLASSLSVVWSEDYIWPIPEIDMAIDVVLSVPAGHVFLSALAAALGTLFLIIILAGVSVLIKRNLFTLAKTLPLMIAWIVAVGIMGSIALLYGPAFANEMEGIERWHYEQLESKIHN